MRLSAGERGEDLYVNDCAGICLQVHHAVPLDIVLWAQIRGRTCVSVHPFSVHVHAYAYMLSAVSQCARRGPVYLVFITKPFTEAPIRIKPLSAHADHRTQPGSMCVKEGVCKTTGTGRGLRGLFSHVFSVCCILFMCICTFPHRCASQLTIQAHANMYICTWTFLFFFCVSGVHSDQ